MASGFPEVGPGQVGLYVGIIASSFALAQFATNFFWGLLSDRIGRKPVILMGTLLTAACFVAFGFCRTLWQAIVVQALMGLVNGNQGVVSTMLGEITDRSNQSNAFTYLPVIYGLGGITGPLVGGLLVSEQSPRNRYPYLPPNLVSAAVLVVDLIIAMIFLDESLEEAKELPPLGTRIGSLFSWVWQFASSSRPSYLRTRGHNHRHHDSMSGRAGDETLDENDDGESDSDTASQSSMPIMFPHHNTDLTRKQVLNRDTILLLSSYLIFQFSNISYNSLYPIFAQADPPTGRNLSPEEIGLSLAFAGIVTIIFQIGVFGKLREKMGNKITYRVGLGGFVLAFLMMPWVGYKNWDDGDGGISSGKAWLWAELGFILLVKTVAAVTGLTSALLLVRGSDPSTLCANVNSEMVTDIFIQITNSAPNHSVLGTLNGLAQTLSAAGRAAGPFLSGGLFSLATHVKAKGEALAFGVFGGVAFVGFLMSFGIRGTGLEAEGWDEEDGSEGDEDEGHDGNVGH